MALCVYNTLTQRKEEFEPLIHGQVRMYACGVTVYDLCHVGHARSAIAFDVIVNYLRYKGYQVTFVRNFTDVDDKIIRRAKETSKSWQVVAEENIQYYYEDMGRLGVQKATIEPKATEHIKEMQDIIKGLIDQGYAYNLEGDVYFEIRKFREYGKLSHRNLEELLSGARVEVDERKKDPLDFALWKRSKEGEPAWDSPWGMGRPGWHIECSAMSMKLLGESFDIHGGGADLIFPHHENEIAQSEGYTGKSWVKYWLHNGFVTINKEKMSKSLGNFFTIREVLKKYDPEVLRFFLLSAHYRGPLDFSDQHLEEAKAALERIYNCLRNIDTAPKAPCLTFTGEPGDEGVFVKEVQECQEHFERAMDDDFNTPDALGGIFKLVRAVNTYLADDYKAAEEPSVINLLWAQKVLKELLTKVLGFKLTFQGTTEQQSISVGMDAILEYSDEKLETIIKKREEARKQKNWALADKIRKELEEQGVILEDRPGGPVWRRKP